MSVKMKTDIVYVRNSDGEVVPLPALKGDKGDTGAQGPQGIQGEKGDPGTGGDVDLSEIEATIGDMTTIQVANVDSLVAAINSLYGSFMESATYKDKKLTLVYRNGNKFEIDVSSVITDTSVGELDDVMLTDVAEGDALYYDSATKKFKNKATGHSALLDSAKKYTDDQISALDKAPAHVVTEKPTVETAADKEWYYYQENGVWEQTIFIDGTEITIETGSADLSDCVRKDTDVISEYDETYANLDLIPDLHYLKAVNELVSTALGLKVNTGDIVDSLTSDSVNKPLSAAQGKYLAGALKTISDSFTTHSTNGDIHTSLAEKSKWNAVENKVDKSSVLTSRKTNPEDVEIYNAKTVNDIVGGVSGAVYSTEETLTGGTWIDGKPIYRKVIDFGSLSTGGVWKNVEHNVANVDTIWIDFSASFGAFQNGTTMPITYPEDSFAGQVTCMASRSTISVWNGTDRSAVHGYITILCTKTTD